MKRNKKEQGSGGALWFVALIPEEPVRSEVQEMKRKADASFDSSHALNSPPHITLIPPFRLEKQELAQAEVPLMETALRYGPFDLLLSGFGHFGKRVIFVNVEASEALTDMQAELERKMLSQKRIDFRTREEYHPHMTVAFKDLRRSRFDDAMEYYVSLGYKARFRVEHIHLLRHRDKRWNVHRSWKLVGGG